MSDPGPDGYGPPPSADVQQAVEAFFADGTTPSDPRRVEQISAKIRAREEAIPWNSHKNH